MNITTADVWRAAHLLALMLISWTAGVEWHRWYTSRDAGHLISMGLLAVFSAVLFSYLLIHPKVIEARLQQEVDELEEELDERA